MINNMSMKKAAIINMVSKYIVIFINLLYSSFLARILSPSDYGVVAIVNVFVSFFSILSDMGVGNAVIQNQQLTESDINSIYSWSMRLSIKLSLLFCLMSIPISLIYNNNVYYIICPLLSISVFFSTLNMIPSAVLMKQKRFLTVALRQIIVCVFSSVIAILLALIGIKYYALVAYSVVLSFGSFLWNIRNSNLKLKWKYDKNSIEKVKNFSNYLFGFNIINYFSRNLDNILIGKFQGEAALGYYNKAYQLMLYPMNNLTGIVTPILLPFLSKYQNNANYVYVQYKKTIKVLSLIGVYITVFCFFASNELVIILYGDNWRETIPCFQFLSISIWSQMICATAGSMFQILGKTKTHFIRGIITVAITISAIIIGNAIGGINEVALFVTIAYISNFFSMLFFLVKHTFKMSVLKFLSMLVPDIIIAIILILESLILNQIVFSNIIISFFVKLLVSGAVYIILLFAFNQIKYFSIIVPQKIKLKFPQIFNI